MFTINEIFTSIQTEGPFAGEVARFIRFQGCNLRCPFCDSKSTQEVDSTSFRQMDAEQIVKDCYSVGMQPGDLVVITGGEPFYQVGMPMLLNRLRQDFHVQVETNGTYSLAGLTRPNLFLKTYPLDIVISPKPHPGGALRDEVRTIGPGKQCTQKIVPMTYMEVPEFHSRHIGVYYKFIIGDPLGSLPKGASAFRDILRSGIPKLPVKNLKGEERDELISSLPLTDQHSVVFRWLEKVDGVYLQPMSCSKGATQECIDALKSIPSIVKEVTPWRLSIQYHKMIGIQ